jgi:hypothetical protein
VLAVELAGDGEEGGLAEEISRVVDLPSGERERGENSP